MRPRYNAAMVPQDRDQQDTVAETTISSPRPVERAATVPLGGAEPRYALGELLGRSPDQASERHDGERAQAEDPRAADPHVVEHEGELHDDEEHVERAQLRLDFLQGAHASSIYTSRRTARKPSRS